MANLLRRHQRPERFGNVVAQRPVERHPEERQLLRHRVDLRVRRHRRTQLAGKVISAHGAGVAADLRRQGDLEKGEDAAAVDDDVGVRLVAGTDLGGLVRDRLLAEVLGGAVGAHPPAAVIDRRRCARFR